MKSILLFIGSLFLVVHITAQSIAPKLEKAFAKFENDSQLKYAISSLYVIDAATGQAVFDRNSHIGLAGASTQKIITAATAFELLGKDYRYQTTFSIEDKDLYVYANGDPTFGSWRYAGTRDTLFFNTLIGALREKGIKEIKKVTMTSDEINVKSIPSGWIYEDLGNYYGTAPRIFNWRENQYDLVLIPGEKPGDKTTIDQTSTIFWPYLINESTTGPFGSGDNAYIYPLPNNPKYIIKGTIPAGVKKFTISGSDPVPTSSFASAFTEYAATKSFYKGDTLNFDYKPVDTVIFNNPVYIHYSPGLDSIVYWFLKKSINLYGEALIRTMSEEKLGVASTDSGVNVIRKFWKGKGLDEDEINLYDGSGLSPQNRVTTHAEVMVLKYARTRDWFSAYLQAFPEYNGMKMKSGTIGDAKGFCGYQESKDGKLYIFSFIVNNYNGKSSTLVSKMYKVLDELK